MDHSVVEDVLLESADPDAIDLWPSTSLPTVPSPAVRLR